MTKATEKLNDIIIYSLAEACEIIPRIARREIILQWHDNPELKILIQEKNKENRKKKRNGNY